MSDDQEVTGYQRAIATIQHELGMDIDRSMSARELAANIRTQLESDAGSVEGDGA